MPSAPWLPALAAFAAAGVCFLHGAVALPDVLGPAALERAVVSAFERSDEVALLSLADALARRPAPPPEAARTAAWACLAAARRRLETGAFAPAAALVDRAERLLPADPHVAVYRIWQAHAQGDRGRADRLAAAFPERFGGDPAALEAFARLLFYRVDRRYSARVRAALERSLETGDPAERAEAAARAASFSLERGDPREARRLLSRARELGAAGRPLEEAERALRAFESPAPLPAFRLILALASFALAWRIFGTRAAFVLAALFALAQFHRLDAPARAGLALLLFAALLRFRLALAELLASYYAAHGRVNAAAALLRGLARLLPRRDRPRLRLAAVARRVAAGDLARAAAELAAEREGGPSREAVAALLHSRRRDLPAAHAAALGGGAHAAAWQVRVDDLVRVGRPAAALALLDHVRGRAVYAPLALKACLVAGDAEGAAATLAALRPRFPSLPCEDVSYALLYAGLLLPETARRAALAEAALYHARNGHAVALAAFAHLDEGDASAAADILARARLPDPAPGVDSLLAAARFCTACRLGSPPAPPVFPAGDAHAAARFRVSASRGVAAAAEWRDARARLASRLAAVAAAVDALEAGAPPPPPAEPDPDLLFAPELAFADALAAPLLSPGRSTRPFTEAPCSTR